MLEIILSASVGLDTPLYKRITSLSAMVSVFCVDLIKYEEIIHQKHPCRF